MDTLEPASVCLDVAYVDWTLTQYCPGPQVRAGNNPRANACLRSGFSPSYARPRPILWHSIKSLGSGRWIITSYASVLTITNEQIGALSGNHRKKSPRSC